MAVDKPFFYTCMPCTVHVEVVGRKGVCLAGKCACTCAVLYAGVYATVAIACACACALRIHMRHIARAAYYTRLVVDFSAGER